MAFCEIEGCGNPAKAKSLCAKHYQRKKRHGDALAGGSKPDFAGKLRPKTCQVESCQNPHMSLGYCAAHYRRRRAGRDVAPLVKPRRHGQKYLDGNGYVCFTDRDHPHAGRNGRVLEHRAIMAEKLGRPLLPGESVHHVNGERADNRPENLELWVTYQPAGQRPEDLLAWAHEIIRRYG